jgi:hypothetical protein
VGYFGRCFRGQNSHKRDQCPVEGASERCLATSILWWCLTFKNGTSLDDDLVRPWVRSSHSPESKKFCCLQAIRFVAHFCGCPYKWRQSDSLPLFHTIRLHPQSKQFIKLYLITISLWKWNLRVSRPCMVVYVRGRDIWNSLCHNPKCLFLIQSYLTLSSIYQHLTEICEQYSHLGRRCKKHM